MICYQPITLTNENYYFSRGLKPDKFNKTLIVPCGKCLACRSNKAREWSMRFSQEWNYYKQENTMFLTLTLDHIHLKNNEVEPRELQLFIKKVRRYFDSKRHRELHGLKEKPKIKYLGCGEYGKLFGRAHYHMIIFGLPNHLRGFRKVNRVHKARCLMDLVLYKKWNNGGISIGFCSNKSINYCAQYGLKSSIGVYCDKKRYKEKYGRNKPFLVMSKGIGKRYALDNAQNLMANLFIQYNQSKVSIPRQYMIWLEKAGYDIGDKLKEKALIEKDKMIRDLYMKYGLKPVSYKDFYLFEDYFDITKHDKLYNLWIHDNLVKRQTFESRHKRYLEFKELSNYNFEQEVA